MKQITLFFSPSLLFRKYTEKLPPPLSIAYLAQFLKQHNYQVTCIDSNNFTMFKLDKNIKKLQQFILKKSIQEIEKTQPDFLVISSWTVAMPFTIELIKKFKKRNPNTKILLGGQNATFLPDQTLKLIPELDFIVRGEGQLTLLELLQDKNPNTIPGLSFKKNKKIINTPSRRLLNLDKLPLLDFSYFNLKNQHEFYLMNSFGCPFQCKFCSENGFWYRRRSYTPKYMTKQIKLLQKRFGNIHISFWDSHITNNHVFGKKLLKNIKGSFSTYSRIDTLNKQITKKLNKAGFNWMFFGLESLNPETLLFYNKTTNPSLYLKNAKKTLKLTKKHNIHSILSYIIGAPTENKQQMLNNLSLMQKLKTENNQFELSLLSLELNSPLWFSHKDKIFQIKNKEFIQGYASLQLFTKKHMQPELTPQYYFFKNQHMTNKETENTIFKILKDFREKTLYTTSK